MPQFVIWGKTHIHAFVGDTIEKSGKSWYDYLWKKGGIMNPRNKTKVSKTENESQNRTYQKGSETER